MEKHNTSTSINQSLHNNTILINLPSNIKKKLGKSNQNATRTQARESTKEAFRHLSSYLHQTHRQHRRVADVSGDVDIIKSKIGRRQLGALLLWPRGTCGILRSNNTPRLTHGNQNNVRRPLPTRVRSTVTMSENCESLSIYLLATDLHRRLPTSQK